MSDHDVALWGMPGGSQAGLRELCGYDEQGIDATDTVTAIQLIDRLLVQRFGTTFEPGRAVTLTAADRDRLLATIYIRTYGSRIVGTSICGACGQPFDMDFELPDLVMSLRPKEPPEGEPQNGYRTFQLPDGRVFRLPTGEDELAVQYLPVHEAGHELMRRCVLKGDATADPASVQQAMAEVAPVVDLELDAQCPECGAPQPIHFDIQTYLLSALKSEQPRLTQEVHRVAMAYGWSLNEILSLSRRQRHAYVALIEAEAPQPVNR